MFQQALQAARIEAGKPTTMRMDWNLKKSSYPNKTSKPLTNLKREREEKAVLQDSSRRLKRGFKLLSPADGSEVRAQSVNLFFSIEDVIGSRPATNTNSQNRGKPSAVNPS